MPHAAPIPIPLVAGVVIRFRPLRKIEQRTSVPVEDRLNVPQGGEIAYPANVPAKQPQAFVGHGPETQLPAIAQFPDRRIHIASERVRGERLFRHAPAPAGRMSPQGEWGESGKAMFLELFEFVVWPGAYGSGCAGDESAGGEHERCVRREIGRDFNPFSTRTNAHGAALTIGGQQDHRGRQNVREQKAEPSCVALGRSVLGWKGEIVMRAESLKPRLAFVALTPSAKFLAYILN